MLRAIIARTVSIPNSDPENPNRERPTLYGILRAFPEGAEDLDSTRSKDLPRDTGVEDLLKECIQLEPDKE